MARGINIVNHTDAGVGTKTNRRTRLRGFWKALGWQTLRVGDPAKFLTLLGNTLVRPRVERELYSRPNLSILTPKRRTNLEESGTLSVSVWRQFQDILKAGGANDALQGLEKMLSGGTRKFEVGTENLIVDEGLNYDLDVALAAGTQITTWYIGLVDNAGFTAYAAGDTAAKNTETANPPTTNGWQEATEYDESVRQTWTPGTVSSKSVDNSASKATFTISATVTLRGSILISNNTKGGTTGTLWSANDFGASKSMVDNETLDVQSTYTAADDGV